MEEKYIVLLKKKILGQRQAPPRILTSIARLLLHERDSFDRIPLDWATIGVGGY